MTVDEFRRWWRDQEQEEPFFQRLNAHYAQVESRPEGFDHLGGFAFGDVIALRAFPGPGFSTLLTKGLSGFHLRTHADDFDLMRVELAWTLREDFVLPATVSAFVAAADFALERRRAFHQNEIFVLDFSGLPFPNRLERFMASNGFWFSDGFERLDAEMPMYVFELFALTAEEARAAARDVESFSEYLDEKGIDIDDLAR